MHTCNRCNKALPLTSEFWMEANGKLRLTHCRKCKSVSSMESRRKNKAATNASNAAWKLRNRERNAAINKAWRAANIEKARQAPLLWAKKYPEKHNAKYAKRRAAKLLRTPKWLTQDDTLLIEAKYAVAKWLTETVGTQYHVDHIIPLQGALVSGLHVPDNLCILKASENISKNNKWQI